MPAGNAPRASRTATSQRRPRRGAPTAKRGTTRASSRPGRGANRMAGMSRVERRRAIKARRARLGFVVSIVASMAIFAAWFPASDLLHQRQQLATATTQLDQLRQQDQALAKEQKNLSSPTEISRIARDQYQLVTQGSTPYQVLPKADTAKGSATGMYASDPGAQPPVVPSGDVELPPGAVGTAQNTPASSRSTFFGRILQTLEFWH